MKYWQGIVSIVKAESLELAKEESERGNCVSKGNRTSLRVFIELFRASVSWSWVTIGNPCSEGQTWKGFGSKS